MVNVPAQYQSFVNNAAQALGIPPGVVAAQISTESGFNPGAVSGAGAQGIAQFIPSTWAAYGHGSPFNVSDAFAAYTAYMRSLLNDFHGNLRNALAAYNAGPGNIGAGMGYANGILSMAGSGDITVDGTGDGGGGGTQAQQVGVFQDLGKYGKLLFGNGGPLSFFGGIGDIGTAIAAMVEDLSAFFNMISKLFKASTWLRVGSFFMGILLLVAGAVALMGAVRA